MRALILAGGGGTRLGMGEKPLVTVRGSPMIAYVIDAFEAAGHEGIVVVTGKTPFTRNWCSAHGIPYLAASGAGYIGDIIESAGILGEEGPFFTCVADLPCLVPSLVAGIEQRYRESGMEACSVWIPTVMAEEAGYTPQYHALVSGIRASPAGINILRGDLMERPQEELQLLLRERRLAFNVNTRDELEILRRVHPGPAPERDRQHLPFSDSTDNRRNI